MTLPPSIADKKRAESAADFYTDETLAGAEIDEDHVHTAFTAGYLAACEEKNKEIVRLGAEVEELMKVDYWQDRYNIVVKERDVLKVALARIITMTPTEYAIYKIAEDALK